MRVMLTALLASACVAAPVPCLAAASGQVLELWNGSAPGDKGDLGPEHDATKASDGLVAGKRLIRLANVSNPTVTIYRPPPGQDIGTAMLVCPGGAYNMLALDLEGTEVCDWLNSIGVTGLLLKYRVPKRPGLDPHTAALQDAQRALGLVRHRAREWAIEPERIGVLGFSAGGHLAAALSNNYEQRTYPKRDDADDISCRPDFAVLIYPAYLTLKKEGDKIAPELAITSNTSPTFIAISQDDPIRVEGALFYSLGLQKCKVPFELHVYPKGGHGYGLRRTKDFVTTWPERTADWMRSRGLLAGP